MSILRVERVSALLKRELSLLIEEDFSESFGVISVSDVFVSPDFKNAKVYLSFLNDDKEELILTKINKKAYEYQKLLGRKLKMRYTPKLNFHIDVSLDKVNKIDSLLKEVDNES